MDLAMAIRSYQTGDEHAQAQIYNVAAGSLPGFKPSKPEEIARRYQAGDSDPKARYYATENGRIVGYAVFSSNGRVSCPWCLPGAEGFREPLLETVVAEMKRRGIAEAWAAYRADWSPVLDFLLRHGFNQKRSMINYVALTARIPLVKQLPSDRAIHYLQRSELPRLVELMPKLFAHVDAHALEHFFWENPFYSFADGLLALKDAQSGDIRGASLLVVDDRFADPTKIDSSMPCFRLGAFGTEGERHKRVNGLFSCVFLDENDGDLLMQAALAEDSSRLHLTHLAAQAPSDAPRLCTWYDRIFERQGAFPILSRRLAG
jgi:hypothetical protein